MMKRLLHAILPAVLVLLSFRPASAQNPEEPDMDQIVSKQLDNISRLVKLDDVQTFFVDSVLQHNIPAMMEEMNSARRTGAMNTDTYQGISDKWMAATDDAFEKIFTGEQWARYLKSSFGKEKKRRDKRISERGGMLQSFTGKE